MVYLSTLLKGSLDISTPVIVPRLEEAILILIGGENTSSVLQSDKTEGDSGPTSVLTNPESTSSWPSCDAGLLGLWVGVPLMGLSGGS